MAYKDLPEDLVQQVAPADVREYAIATGWRRLDGVNGQIAVYNHPDSDLDQLIVPLNPDVDGYGRSVADVVANLAEREGRPPLEVLNDLLLSPGSDILRFRVEDPDTARGLIPLEQGISLLEGAKRALLAAACSVVQPRPFHPRLSRADAEQFLKTCRLGQTERGSFTATIACPLDAAEPVPHALPLFTALPESEPEPESAEPFARRVTSLLMRSVARVATAVEADRVDSLLTTGGGDPPLSANLCDALLKLQPPGERSRLSLGATWARTLPPAPGAGPPALVHLRGEHFPVSEALSRTLRPAKGTKTSHFVGLVDSLFGAPDDEGRVRGDVYLLILNQEEVIRARSTLDADDYHSAWEAHGV